VSDRVPYAVGTKKGVDHIYSPIHEQAGGVPDTTAGGYVLGLSLDNIMRWSWRVKKWQITGSVSWTVFPPFAHPSFVVTYTIPGSTFLELKSGAGIVTRERGILHDSLSNRLGNIGWPADVGLILSQSPSVAFPSGVHLAPPDPGWGLELSGNVFETDGNVIFETGAQQFWPHITLKIFASIKYYTDDAPATIIPVGGSFGTYKVTGLGPAPDSATFTIDGISTPIYITDAGFGSPNAINVAVTPVEFWPYQNRLGQPVYDTASGVLVNDPFA
jgi:hypothetical protein